MGDRGDKAEVSEIIGKTVKIELVGLVIGYAYTNKGKMIMVKIKDQELWFNFDDATEITHNE